MTANELIAELQKVDGNADVLVATDGWYVHVESIELPDAEREVYALPTLFTGRQFSATDDI